jgi:hypothetical protein
VIVVAVPSAWKPASRSSKSGKGDADAGAGAVAAGFSRNFVARSCIAFSWSCCARSSTFTRPELCLKRSVTADSFASEAWLVLCADAAASSAALFSATAFSSCFDACASWARVSSSAWRAFWTSASAAARVFASSSRALDNSPFAASSFSLTLRASASCLLATSPRSVAVFSSPRTASTCCCASFSDAATAIFCLTVFCSSARRASAVFCASSETCFAACEEASDASFVSRATRSATSCSSCPEGAADASAFAAASSAARTASSCLPDVSADRATARRTEALASLVAYSLNSIGLYRRKGLMTLQGMDRAARRRIPSSFRRP